MSAYPIQSLLRPPVEYYAAGTHAAAAGTLLAAPEALLMVPSVAYTIAALMMARAAWRFGSARRIHRYQKRLWRLPTYGLSSSQIPVSTRKLFFGIGFSWNESHTQRLSDIEKHPRFREPSRSYQWARQFEIAHETAFFLTPLVAFLQADSHFNPVRPLPPVGGSPAIHSVGLWEGEHPTYIDLADRVGHTLVLGTTRVGKTRAAEIAITQDIRRGDVVIVIDPKGDSNLFRRMYVEAKAAGRLDSLYFFHLGFPEFSARYNPIGNFGRVTEVASRIAGQLPGEGQSQAFREFVWRYVNVIAKALTALGKKADYEQIKYFGEDIEPLFVDYLTFYLREHDYQSGEWLEAVNALERSYANGDEGFRKGKMSDRSDRSMALYRYFKDHAIQDYVAHSLIKTFEYERHFLDKLVGSLLPLMEKLCTGKTAELLSPNYLDPHDRRPIFEWSEVIRTGGIVYVGLDALSDPEVAAAVGNAMLADLTAVSGRLYKSAASQGLINRAVNIHADEFSDLIGDEFVPMVNKAGGAGYQVTAYTQTWSDILARMSSPAKAGQVSGNFNTVLMLRVRELETAEMLTTQLKQVEIDQLTNISRATDSSEPDSEKHFTSTTEDRTTSQRVDLIHPADLTQLPKGHCFALLDGGKPYKLRLPLPDEHDLKHVPRDLALIADEMAAAYTTSAHWYAISDSFVRTA